jgi:hypothetical protein
MDDNWHVLIIETINGYRGRDLTHAIPVGAHLETAIAHAARLAAEHQPRHPMVPRSRQVFHTPPHTWTVRVLGATRSFSFTVQVANLVSEQTSGATPPGVRY